MPNLRPSISLAMIVRNEARFIAQCLASVRDFVPEIIVVDTGSEDTTVRIAREFGATIYSHPWTGDFSEARNFSIERATGDWILILDADETLAARDAERLGELIRNAGTFGFKLTQRTYLRDANVVCATPNPKDYAEGLEYSDCVDVQVIRLFRNDPRIRYHGRVHELVEPAFQAEGLGFEPTPLVIHHYGKVGDTTRLEAKKQLYLELGRLKAAESAGDAMAQFELGVQFYELGRHADCIPCFETALKLNPGYDIALLYIAKAHHTLGTLEKAAEYFRQCLKLWPESDRVLFDYANFVRDRGHVKSAIKVYQRAIAANPRHSLALFNLGAVWIRTGDTERGMDSIRKAIQLNPGNAAFHENLGRLPLTGKLLETAADLLSAFLERATPTAGAFIAFADICFRLSRFEQALDAAGHALKLDPNAIPPRLISAHAEFSLGRLGQAEGSYRELLRLDPCHLDSLMNLASIAEHRRDWVAAAAWYGRAIQAHPEQAQALKRYVVARARLGLAGAEGAADDSVADILERACRRNPSDMQCLTLAGGLLEQSGRAERAAALYEAAADRNPEWLKAASERIERLRMAKAQAATPASL